MEAANKELEEFAYIVAHDLKSPLLVITSIVRLLTEDYRDKLDEAGRELLDMLANIVAERMQRLIEGVLQYSRAGRLKVNEEAVDLNILVSEVIDMINPLEKISIAMVNELPTIVCNKTQMEQVFQNLLRNAVRYIDKREGKITVGCTEEYRDEDGNKGEARYWKFSVADNGPGIEARYYEKIFQIFQTLTPGSKEVETTGVGLSIVKKLVEMRGGKTWVESKVGEGSTFFFTVPKL